MNRMFLLFVILLTLTSCSFFFGSLKNFILAKCFRIIFNRLGVLFLSCLNGNVIIDLMKTIFFSVSFFFRSA